MWKVSINVGGGCVTHIIISIIANIVGWCIGDFLYYLIFGKSILTNIIKKLYNK